MLMENQHKEGVLLMNKESATLKEAAALLRLSIPETISYLKRIKAHSGPYKPYMAVRIEDIASILLDLRGGESDSRKWKRTKSKN
jgi:hypothetical protein